MKKIAIFLVSALVLSCVTNPVALRREPNSNIYDDAHSLPPESATKPIIADLLRQIDKDPSAIRSVEEFLQKVPQDFRSRRTYVYKSASLQEASPENPRAIVFGYYADEVFTFNGDPKHAGFNTIETMIFNKTEKKFEFREITFENNRAHLSKVNPATCLACHGQNPRPNWHSYRFWPGVYGSEEDLAFSRAKIRSTPQVKEIPEIKNFMAFLDNSNCRGLYKYLEAPENCINSTYHRAGGTESKYLEDYSSPNTSITIFFQAMNAQKVMREIRNLSPELARNPYSIVKAFLDCKDQCYSEFPEHIRKELLARYPATLQRVEKENQAAAAVVRQQILEGNGGRFYRDEMNRNTYSAYEVATGLHEPSRLQRKVFGDDNFAMSIDRIAQVVNLVEFFGVKTQDWSLRPLPRGYIFTDGVRQFDAFLDAALLEFFPGDKALYELGVYKNSELIRGVSRNNAKINMDILKKRLENYRFTP